MGWYAQRHNIDTWQGNSDKLLELGKLLLGDSAFSTESEALCFTMSGILKCDLIRGIIKIKHLKEMRNRSNPIIFVDDQEENLQDYRDIVGWLTNYFVTHKKNVECALSGYDLLNDQSRLKHISHGIEQVFNELEQISLTGTAG